jgi:hypothetical protein
VKALALYLVLVGIPVLGVSTIVRMGEKITPPVSVGGIWRAQARPDSSCQDEPFPDSLVMNVAQSGPQLIVHLNARTRPLIGAVDDTIVQVADGNLIVRGVLSSDTSRHVMIGEITGLPCASGLPAVFTAQRTHSAAAARTH